jgi:hypothetical protein
MDLSSLVPVEALFCTLAAMRSAVPRLVEVHGNVILRADALTQVHPSTLWRAVQRGALPTRVPA